MLVVAGKELYQNSGDLFVEEHILICQFQIAYTVKK